MNFRSLAVVSSGDIIYFWLLLFLVFFALFLYFIYGVWVDRERSTPSPYTGNPLRSGAEIHWLTTEKILKFLYNMNEYHNRMFDLRQAGFCRDTGRIFPNAMTWYGVIKVDWSFIQKRYPGKFVSWGSLSENQQLKIIDQHHSLDGFQTKISSPTSSPSKIEPLYAFTKPGPLYVDIDTGVLLGWKCVPDTELEVLIVQKPLEVYIPGLHKKY